MQIQLQQIINGNNKLQRKFVTALKDRSQVFLKCDAFVAALLLDPRDLRGRQIMKF